MIVYKIRKKDYIKKYITGTPTYYSWDNTGRMFQTIGKLRAFLTGFMKNSSRRIDLGDIEVVEYELVEASAKDLHEIIKPEKIMELLRK